MNIELKPIAESKVRQLGGDVFGVLVRNEAGAWAAVSEGGRVMWLDDFEGQPSSAQGGRGADAVKWSDPEVDPIVSKLYRKFKEWNRQGFGADDVTWCEVRGYVAELLNTQSQPAQQGSVPKGENDFGLDARYFHEKLRLILRGINSYTPTEMARALGRLAITANPEAMREPEFNISDLIDQPKYRDATPQPAQHPDDAAVDRFAEAMKAKLAKKRAEGQGGWEDPQVCPSGRLQQMLIDHLTKGDPVDIGNFAMMIWNRGEAVAGQPTQQGSVPEDVIRQCEDAIQYASEIRGGCISGVREAQKRVRAILDTPQPAVPEGWTIRLQEDGRIYFSAPSGARGSIKRRLPKDDEPISDSTLGRAFFDLCSDLLSTHTTLQADGWVRCEDRLPTYRDSDEYGDVWAMSKLYGVKKMSWSSVRADFKSHWMPTGLKRPQPPQEGA